MIAHDVLQECCYQFDLYTRPTDEQIEWWEGWLVGSSNDDASIISHSPTETWEFPDGSMICIRSGDAYVLRKGENWKQW